RACHTQVGLQVGSNYLQPYPLARGSLLERASGDLKLARRRFIGYETRHQPLLSRAAFARRLARSVGGAALFIALSLFGGMAGYRPFEGMEWIDAFANAAMILSGMGPLTPLQTWGGKLFAGLYALYSGLLVIVTTGVIFAPILHRMVHRFHADMEHTQRSSPH